MFTNKLVINSSYKLKNNLDRLSIVVDCKSKRQKNDNKSVKKESLMS